jgi:uracil-DNA glycosylase
MWKGIEKKIPQDWFKLLAGEFEKAYWSKLIKKLNELSEEQQIQPIPQLVFNLFKYCRVSNLKVVILGQDPYIHENEAVGMSFSVPPSFKIPPSLRNIFKELKQEYCLSTDFKNGDLTHWAEDGCLLLNTVMTVNIGKSNSHRKIGWEDFTSAVLKIIHREFPHVLFVGWGSQAKTLLEKSGVSNDRMFLAGHPSPINTKGDFFGCHHFVKINERLMENGYLPIRWVKA